MDCMKYLLRESTSSWNGSGELILSTVLVRSSVIYVAGHRGKCKHSDFIQGFGAEDSSSCECEVRIFLKSCVVYLDVILIVVS